MIRWTPTKTEAARRFLVSYSQELVPLIDCARRVEDLVRLILKRENLAIHQIAARAKSLDSMRLKLRRKKYKDPGREITDKLGVRIITYYSEDVDRVAEVLKGEFTIDRKNSQDKRVALGTDAFGYRSVHLIAGLKGSRLLSAEYAALRGKCFEIQVRSLLEHAWAEIEHEVKYKPRIEYPPSVVRRFARIAGVLELLDTEFKLLKEERDDLINGYKEVYRQKQEYDEPFDSARLLGFLEAARPEGLSWRAADADASPFPIHIEASCVDALNAVGLNTARKLARALKRKGVTRCLDRFSQVARVAPDEISHFAVILMVVRALAPTRLADLFPAEVCNSSEIREMVRDD
jgi:ppGpp synthetase/RelA/SpoT-type nucleotidyltranferase